MAVFQFRGVVAASGKEVKGVRDAEGPKGLRAVLRREGIVLTSATEARTSEKKSRDIQLFAFLNKPNTGDVAIATRQLATLVRAGIPLTDAIAALTDQVQKEEFKRVLANVRNMVNEGTAFATALAEHPQVFPNLYVNMVAAGEASGTLEAVLDRLAEFMNSQAKLKGKVMAAMAYPFLMVIIGSILLTVLMIGVVPKVTAIFDSLGRALPWYTALLIFVSNTFVSPIAHGLLIGTILGAGAYVMGNRPVAPMTRHGVAVQKKQSSTGALAAISIAMGVLALEVFFRSSITWVMIMVLPGLVLGAAIGTMFAWLKTPKGRLWFDGKLLRAPIFGKLFSDIATARFARTLSTLLASGVQLLRAMDIVRVVIGNAELEKVVEEATSSIREGESIAEPLKRSKRFDPMVIHMIAVGEKSGQLEQMLNAASDSYETAVEVRITALTALLEPLTIVLMGGAIGFIAFSILMPLIQMNDFNQ